MVRTELVETSGSCNEVTRAMLSTWFLWIRSLREADLASSRGSLLLVDWLVERDARPVVVVEVVMIVVEEGDTEVGVEDETGVFELESIGVDMEDPKGLCNEWRFVEPGCIKHDEMVEVTLVDDGILPVDNKESLDADV